MDGDSRAVNLRSAHYARSGARSPQTYSECIPRGRYVVARIVLVKTDSLPDSLVVYLNNVGARTDTRHLHCKRGPASG